ncbi:hypothetical protein ESCCO14588_3050 [Escherichia coli O157:H7 str. TW14588]|nr:hypothetical protein EDL933_1796 [Escherichia coli O157:H7 str. EDL933]EDU85601.1 hypothetical protein ECH7EC4501_4436 [Escherichia coli O157:H7 str. EC4501]EEC26869.1 hypothetical protein ESCCO14588_3050 [Escherichia coli O157:H7 str. TW14588]EGD63217.1 hypothetical protein ECoA_04435 [Escherichia coli O157:H7 str. 1044]EHU63069.1 hypothetical protein ECDEC3A_1489 [Escherichia coli DEC3A]EHU63503.1 hypothetical protein ECDEC3B_1577 [Escherichia coli DEC3B]EHU73933.1 hypothetical protein E
MIFSKFASGEHRGNQPNPLILSETAIGGIRRGNLLIFPITQNCVAE